MQTNTAQKHSAHQKGFTFQLRYIIASLLFLLIATAIIWPTASAAGNDAQSHIGASGTNGLGAVARDMTPPIGVQQEPPASVNAQISSDITLSAITVDGTDVPSFVAAQEYFNYGVASTTDTVTVAVTTTHDGASAIITPADSDNDESGHQVNLTSGMNSITIAVTAEDGMTARDNTLNVNRGVTETYGWKAVEDLDTIRADRDEIHHGLAHHDSVFWTANRSTDKLHAYAADGTRDTTKDISLHADNGVPANMWTDGTHIYVLDGVDNKTYTYRNSDGAHVSTKDFDLHSDNDDPVALASDGATMWVADATDNKLYAYNLSDGTRTAQQQALEFDLVSNNADPRGLWTDGFTIWVSNANPGGSNASILAYSAFDGDRMSSLDYNTLAGADNRHPRAITATTTTMFVLDDGNVKVYSYNHPRSPNTSLSGITVDDNSIPSFFPAGNSFEHGVAHDTPQVTIAATALHTEASVAITPGDADAITDGHQVSLSAGRNPVTITVTAEDTTISKTYTVNVNRGVTTPLGWKAESDIDSLKHHGSEQPHGVWTDSDNIWVVDLSNQKIHGFNRTTQALTRTINLDTSKQSYTGVWSDGTYIWVSYVRPSPAGLIAYRLSDGTRATDKDFTTLAAAGNTGPFSIWSDGITMWVADYSRFKAFAYRMSDDPNTPANEFATRDGDKDISLSNLWDNSDEDATGVWSDGSTIWVAGPYSNSFTNELRAYRQSDRAHQANLDIDIEASGNDKPGGIYYDGTTFYVTDTTDDKVYTYNMSPGNDDATLSALTVGPKNIIGFDADRTAYEVGVASTVATATITATPTDADATVAITPGDADAITDGHQVSLSPGHNAVTITVTAEDTRISETYTVNVNRGVTTPLGWKAESDIDSLKHHGSEQPHGVWTDSDNIWVVDLSNQKIHGFNRTTQALTRTINLDTSKQSYTGVWSDGTYIWVSYVRPSPAGLIAYRLSDGTRATDKDFTTLAAAGNTGPFSIWSDGITMWVADYSRFKAFAYRMSDDPNTPANEFATRDGDKDISLSNLWDNSDEDATGVWSDGSTIWVAGPYSNSFTNELRAYRQSDRAHQANLDIDIEASGNDKPGGIYYDGTTFYVTDTTDDKVYAYNMRPARTDATLSGISVAGNDVPSFDPDDTSYEVAVASTVAEATITATPTDADATVAYSGTDANTGTDGHQVALTQGESHEVTITVTAEDTTTTKTYTVTVRHISADATLSALTVGPKNIIGFEADRTDYDVGVASTVATATITATPNHASATVAITPADSDTHTDGHQVSLSAGRNAVTITVTAEDTTTKTYTVSVNQGVTDPFGWKAESDIDSLKHHGLERPRGVWADSDNIWVVDAQDEKIYGFNRTTQALTRTIDLDTSKHNYVGVWSDGTHIWVSYTRPTPVGLIAYQISDGARATDKDFTTLAAAGNTNPFAIWSDGSTMWVADIIDFKAYAYHTADDPGTPENEFATRDEDKDISLSNLWNRIEFDPTGVWSDGSTIWVAAAPVSDPLTIALRAYRQSDRTHQAHLDIDINASGNTDPKGIYYDGSTFYVTDGTDDKVYAYNTPPSTDATLSALTVSPKNIIGFNADRTSYEIGVASTVSQATIAATATDSGATVAITPADTDDITDGHQVSLSAGRNAVTVTVTAEDTTTTKTYTVSVNQGVTDGFGWNADKDLDGLIAAENTQSQGIWSDGTTMWVVQSSTPDKLFAFSLSDGTRDTAKEQEALTSGNTSPFGIWGNTTNFWVSDLTTGQASVYAYRRSDGAYRAGDSFTNQINNADNDHPRGIWSDGTTIWVADVNDDKLYAYNLTSKSRTPSQDFDTLKAAGNIIPLDIWSDGTMMWVSDTGTDKIYAYSMSTKEHVPERDFNTLAAVGNNAPVGIWSDGTTMWVSDNGQDKIYSYNMPPANTDATLSGISVAGNDIAGFEPDDTSYTIGVASTVSEATVTATPNDAYATVVYSGTDADTGTDGHQVALTAGEYTDVTITVTAEDDSTTEEYTLTIYRGSTADFAWRVDDDEERLIPSDNLTGAGVWADANDLYVVDNSENRVFVYNRADRSADYRYFDLDADNSGSSGITSDGTTFWVSDSLDHHLYAYAYGNGDRQAVNDIDHHALGVTDITGIWERDGTIWGVRPTGAVVAIDSSEKTLVPDLNFSLALALEPGEEAVSAWHDGVTAWVAVPTSSGTVLRAINVADDSRNTALDFTTLRAAGVENVGAIWSDGDVMWVVDNVKDKVYSFNVPESTNADLRTITLAEGDGAASGVASFAPATIGYDVTADNTVAQVTVAAETVQFEATGPVISPADADSDADNGHQVNAAVGETDITFAVTAEDGVTTKTYTVTVTRAASTDATLSALTVNPKNIIGFEADRAYYETGVASTVETATITATPNHANATVAITPSDADAVTDGHQVSLSAGRNAVTITVTAEDTTTSETYTVDVNRGVTDDFGWKADDDIDGIVATGNDSPYGTWSDGATIWIADFFDRKIYAYQASDGAPNPAQDFGTLDAADNHDPRGIWSNGATMWVADNTDNKIYAYRMSDKQRDSSKDFDTLASAGNSDPYGIWSDGITMWVTDSEDVKIYAYRMSDKQNQPGRTFQTLLAGGNTVPTGITSNGETMWVADIGDHKIYAYEMADTQPDASKNFETLNAAENNSPQSLWSDANTMLVIDSDRQKVFSYNIPVSANANLRDLIVAPKNIIGFDADRTSYEVGVASTVTQASLTADPVNNYGTLAFGGDDASTDPGHQVNLSAGQNTVTVTVTAQDETTTKAYTVNINRGVAEDYGWKASDDLDGFAAADLFGQVGIAGSGSTYWVTTENDSIIYAFNILGYAKSTENITPHSDNGNPAYLWANATNIYVVDDNDTKVYIYQLSDGTRQTSSEFSFHADNADPAGIWSDGATVWIVDTADTKLYAYTLSGGARDGDKDIDLDSDNGNPTGAASNGTTIWVADATDDKAYAYELESGDRIATKEVNALTGAGNTDPTGMWVTNTTLLVNDVVDSKAYSYNIPSGAPLQEMDDATLSALTIAPKDIIGFDAGQDYYEVGFASTVTQATVTATATNSAADVTITPADAGTADGHQVDLAAGRNIVAITVTSQDGNETEVYTLSLNRGVTTAYRWKASEDFDGLIAAGVEAPTGIWSNDTTMWVVDTGDTNIVAYSVADKTRQTSNDVNLDSENQSPSGLWSNGTTFWVADNHADKIFAYQASDGARDSDKDFNTLDTDNDHPNGIWSNGTTMWVSEARATKIYAYRISDKQRDETKEFNLATANSHIEGIWSDGVIMWATQNYGTFVKLFAYRMSDGEHVESRDFNTLEGLISGSTPSITSDGITMWVANSQTTEIGGLSFNRSKIFSFNMAPASTDARLGSLTVSPRDIIGFEPDRTSYQVGVASDVTQATVTALPNNDYGTIVYSGTDADLTADGHQVNLSAGRNELTVTVTAQDTTTTREYTLSINRGVDTVFGWKAVDDLDRLHLSVPNDRARGITQHSGTTWINYIFSRKILAYRADGQRDPSRDITLASGNGRPEHLWTDGTYIWVLDSDDRRIYVYRLSDGQRQQAKEFPLHGDSFNPTGIWSDGDTMWVVEAILTTTHAYSLDGGTRQQEHEFDLASDNEASEGAWSDGDTIWLADTGNDKLYAYRLSTGSRDSDKDFNTLSAAGISYPNGIWSDGTTMWVVDQEDNKVYSFNHPASDNADLSSLTVSPRDLIGFDPEDDYYDVGVASTVAQATITATKAHIYASVAYSGTDASLGTPGHQVDLSPGKNTVTITVTAQDESTMTYTVYINRGVTDPYGWKAEHDLDGLIRTSSTDRPVGVAEHAGIIWVTTTQSNQIRAYNLDGTHAATKDITPHTSNGDPTKLWTDGTTMWVVDSASTATIYAYRLSDGARQTALEISLHTDNDLPAGIWSDNQTIWVLDAKDDRLYAYALDGGNRQEDREFTLDAENTTPTGIWADGSTIWVSDTVPPATLFAYHLNTGTRDALRDFNTLLNAENRGPTGLWSDGTTMWVVDSDRNKVYSYNMPLASPANLQGQSGDTQVTLTWANPDNSDITGYQYRISNNGGTTWNPDWTPIPGSSHRTTSFTVRNLPNGVEHVIEVRALESVLQSAGARATVTPLGPPGLPLEPTNLKVDSLDQQLRFSWEPPSAEDLRVPTTSYDVRHRRYGRSDRWQNATRSNTDLTTVQLVTGLTNRVPYEVQVAAVNSIGRGPWAAYSGVPQGQQSPPATGGDAGLDLGPLGLHWTDGNNPHALHRDTADLNRNVIRNQCLSTETFTVIWPVLDRTPEEYQAHFITDGGAGEVTHEYRAERVPTGENQEREQQYIRGRVTVHRDTRVTVRVRARFDPEGWSTWSHPAALYCYEGPPALQSLFQLATVAVAPPDNLQAQSGDTTVTLTWNQAESDAITGYEYRVSVNTGGTWSPDWTLVPGSARETTSFTVEGLANGLLHTFDVRTLERLLRSEQARAAATPRGAVTTPPEPPVDLELRGSNGALRASWKHPAADPRAPITSYDVRYRIYGSSDPWTEVTRSDTNRSNRQTISRLTNRVAYEIQVAAVNRIGQGPWTTDSRVPQPNQPRPDEAANANADLRLNNVAAWWTTSDHGGRHPDTTSVNVIENQCLETESFIVQWDDLSRQPEEFEAHFITYAGAGEVTHEYRTENGQARIYGSVPLHRDSNVRIQVRARFDPEGWTTWSKPAGFYCFVPEPEEDEQQQQQQAQQNEPTNSPATGKPTINGRTEEGDALTVSTSQIADANGMNDAAFSYQWSRYNGTTTTPIPGATGSTYTLQEADLDHQVSVTVSFTDDEGFAESVTSEEVDVQPPSPLYGGFVAGTVPDEHDGDNAFKFEIRFSEEPSLGFAAVRDHVLDVTNGDVTAVKRATTGSNIRWHITLEPDGDEDVTVVLPPTTDCSAQGAVCTEKGKMLSNRSTRTIPGPGTTSQQVQVENSPATGQPTITGNAAIGETLSVNLSAVSDTNGTTNASYSYQWLADGMNIPGATGSTYTIADSDEGKAIKVKVSFTDDDDFPESVTSAATAAVPARPNTPSTGGPSIQGILEDGEQLTADTVGIADTDGLTNVTIAYQWMQVDGGTPSAITGQTASTYTLTANDVGRSIQLQVSFTDDRGAAESLTSAATGAVVASGATRKMLWLSTITVEDRDNLGTDFGFDSSVDQGSLSPAAFTEGGTTYSIAFLGTSFNSATTLAFEFSPLPTTEQTSAWRLVLHDTELALADATITESNIDPRYHRFEWDVTALPINAPNLWGDGHAFTVSLQEAVNLPATGVPTIGGTAQAGQMLTADTTGIADANGMTRATYTYQWLRGSSPVSGATGSTYTVVSADESHNIKVAVSFTDDDGFDESRTSDSVHVEPDETEQDDPPGAPTSLTAKLNGDGSITLSWNAPDDDTVDGYQILRRRPQQGESELAVYVDNTGSDATTYTDTGTDLDTRYVYRVKAKNAHGVGPWSNFVRIDK